MDFLDHQVFQVGQRVAEVFRVAAHVGGHIFQNRLFTQIKLDHLRHVRINGLIVRHTRADGVAQRHIAASIDIEQAGTAQGRGGTKSQRVQKVVVHPAVNHIHPLGAARGPHVHKVVLDKQVLPFDQFNTHLLRQKRMLEIRRVVHAGGQHHHRRVGCGRGCRGPQGFQQQVGVVRYRSNAVFTEQVREKPHHHLAVLQHVAHAAGHTQVVFQHVVLPIALRIGCANNVNAADVRVNVAGHIHPHHLGAKLRVLENLLGRNNAGLQDVLAVVHVVDKAVQRRDALHQALFHGGPFVRGNDAGNQVKGNQAFGA